ncbi:MAG: preprotein translocase subunit SecE [Candidatus Omnitrophica bacterium]|nr:preprotein translocase subunit SecE [Candidatus Omnitrophota bacterium]
MDILLKNLKVIIPALIGAIALFLVIKNFSKIKTFLLEVKVELGKVSWSTRQELAGSTAVVIVLTFIMAVYIGIIDLTLSKILSLMFK